MYKVFFNDSTIQMGEGIKKSSYDSNIQTVDCDNPMFVDTLISEIESSEKKLDFVLLNNDTNKLWNSFKSQLIEIPAAGGLVVNKNHSLLFIKRWGVWDLPKGKIEKRETAEHAAIREVEEECSVSGLKIIKQLDSTFHLYRSPYLNFPNNMVLKETKWFLMNCEGQQTLIPQVEENIEEVKWFALNELDIVMQNTYLSLREFMQKSIPFI